MTASYRRPATLIERSTPCQCCAFPLTQRHHLCGVAKYGENEFTVQLCPNCHRIYHLIDEADHGNKESHKLLEPLMQDNKSRDWYFLPLLILYQDQRVFERADQHRQELLERDRETIERRIQ